LKVAYSWERKMSKWRIDSNKQDTQYLERVLDVFQVGAALSMVYVSGVPVMFVGCGQTYTDLKKLNVKSIVKSLLV
jgi:hypothetical protein